MSDESILSLPTASTITGDEYTVVVQEGDTKKVLISNLPSNTGPAGEDGATWYTGSTVPSSGLGVNNDLYLRTSNDDVYKKSSGTWSVIANLSGGGGGGGINPGVIASTALAVSLEPDAIEIPFQVGAFNYTVGPTELKYILCAWYTRLGDNGDGRFDVRNPNNPLPIKDITLHGLSSDPGGLSNALILNPTLPTYTNPLQIYYDRLELLNGGLPTKVCNISGITVVKKPMLPGPYGIIITHYTCFDWAWLVLRPYGGNCAVGFNIGDEISDSYAQRQGTRINEPMNKSTLCELENSSFYLYGGGTTPGGALTYVILPANWSKVPDSNNYTFRDDFMGTTLNTGIWSRTQSTVGNIEIDTNFQWLKFTGNGVVNVNSFYRTTTEPRVTGTQLIQDVYIGRDTAALGMGMVGWHDGGGFGFINCVHALNFHNVSGIQVYESGTLRGAVFATYTYGSIYRIRITLQASSAIYEIQGLPEFPVLGGPTWATLTPPDPSSSSVMNVTPGGWCYSGTSYVSDIRVVVPA